MKSIYTCAIRTQITVYAAHHLVMADGWWLDGPSMWHIEDEPTAMSVSSNSFYKLRFGTWQLICAARNPHARSYTLERSHTVTEKQRTFQNIRVTWKHLLKSTDYRHNAHISRISTETTEGAGAIPVCWNEHYVVDRSEQITLSSRGKKRPFPW